MLIRIFIKRLVYISAEKFARNLKKSNVTLTPLKPIPLESRTRALETVRGILFFVVKKLVVGRVFF